MPLLLAVRAIRSFVLYAALERLQPLAELRADDMPMPLATLTLVLLAWIVAPLALGAWRTSTRDA